MAPTICPPRPSDKRVALVLQGGGALGAYQAGVFEALHRHGFHPDWVAGTSIGAFNGAIIAGSPGEAALERLREFWETLTLPDYASADHLPAAARQVYSMCCALASTTSGRPGFFRPRIDAPLGALGGGSAETASYYDTTPLRTLLERLVDFEEINTGHTRLSVGAVNVTTGQLRYFDSHRERIDAQHVMASGALPPAFPAVRVEGDLYWDGGIYSNTPIDVVLEDTPRVDTLCIAVALFPAEGPEPRSLPEVEARHKDIIYGSRSQRHIEGYRRMHNLRRAIDALHQRLPKELHTDPEIRRIADLGCRTTMHIAQLIYPTRDWELSTKDIDFSRASIHERWQAGYDDALHLLKCAPWRERTPQNVGVVVHECPRDAGHKEAV